MNTVTRTATIAAPAAAIWSTLADFSGISGWAGNVDHSCLTSEQTQGVGMTRRVQTGPLTLLETVETWEPEVRLGYRLDGLPAVIKSVTNTWELKSDGDYTVVSLTSRINAGPRPPQKAIARVVGQRLAKASVEMLNGLTNHVTKGAGA
jgi:hypothetical protein